MLFTLSYAQHLVVEHNTWATPPGTLCIEQANPMIDHIKQENHKYKEIRFQILAQASAHETNKELWLKRHKYLWICRLGTLNKLSKKGLNKLIYDPNFHSNTDI